MLMIVWIGLFFSLLRWIWMVMVAVLLTTTSVWVMCRLILAYTVMSFLCIAW